MSKIFFNISDSSYYSDNRFGAFLENMCKEANQDCILVFREHVCCISYYSEDRIKGSDFEGLTPKQNNYLLSYLKIEDHHEHKDMLTVFQNSLIEKEVECYKYLGFDLMKTFRDLYPELKTVDFPVEEFKMWFESNSQDHVFYEGD